MRFSIIEEHKPEEKPPVEPKPEQKKMPIERIKGILDNFGANLAADENTPIKERIVAWTDMLKWARPLIPDDEQAFKAHIQKSIDNPSEWDFKPKPKGLRLRHSRSVVDA